MQLKLFNYILDIYRAPAKIFALDFNYLAYIQRALNGTYSGNQAGRYAVSIVTDFVPGDENYYWKCILVHHLLPEENIGKHNIYIDALDENGNILTGYKVKWDWAGRRPNERHDSVLADKGLGEPKANMPIWYGQHIEIQIDMNDLLSDRVINLHTEHPDEPGPNGQNWNSLGHHSFYCVFQRTKKNGNTEPEPEPNGCDEELLNDLVKNLNDMSTIVLNMEKIVDDLRD